MGADSPEKQTADLLKVDSHIKPLLCLVEAFRVDSNQGKLFDFSSLPAACEISLTDLQAARDIPQLSAKLSFEKARLHVLYAFCCGYI